jgi:hypothetical protein
MKQVWLCHVFFLVGLSLFQDAMSANMVLASSPDLSAQVLHLATRAYHTAVARGDVRQGVMTVIDYSKPSNEKRLWVIDMLRQKVIFHTYVAHGKKSGALYAKRFSNRIGSHKSSLGVYATQHAYTGSHGYALRLQGLEPHINDKAHERDIVMHSQWYVKDPYPSSDFQTGRSWGCPVVSQQLVKPIIDRIKGGTLLMMYYPDAVWLHHSTYITNEG